MQQRRFEALRERLLRAGVAPRHVHRYLEELRDHHDDAVRAELATDKPLATAREAAWARLGTEESLAEGLLGRPELRSKAARFPALAFGVGPVLAWLAAPTIVGAGALTLLPHAMRHARPSAALLDACLALGFFQTRLLPIVVGALVLEGAARRRLSARWAIVGAGVVDVLAGTLSIYSFPGHLGVTSSLLPWLLPVANVFGPRDLLALGEGLLRAACLLALSVIVQRILCRVVNTDRQRLAAE